MKIELESYSHNCADRCCYTTGYDVFIDGEKIGSTVGEDGYELAELLNEHFNTKENLNNTAEKIASWRKEEDALNQRMNIVGQNGNTGEHYEQH